MTETIEAEPWPEESAHWTAEQLAGGAQRGAVEAVTGALSAEQGAQDRGDGGGTAGPADRHTGPVPEWTHGVVAETLTAAEDHLTDAEREVLLDPCECGHTLNDHGDAAGCWACSDSDGRSECRVRCEDLLAERTGRIVAARVADRIEGEPMSAADDQLRELAQAATPGPWAARECDLEGKPASEYVRTLLANREADGTSSGRLFLTLASNPIDPERGAEVVPALTGDGPSAEANAAYIAAASPDVVLGLLDERDRLARWKAEALPVLDGLQEIGKALGLPLGARITGPQALEAIEALVDARDAHFGERLAALGVTDDQGGA